MWDQKALSIYNVSKWYLKNIGSFNKGTMNDGTLLLSSNYEMLSKLKKNRRDMFKKKECAFLFS